MFFSAEFRVGSHIQEREWELLNNLPGVLDTAETRGSLFVMIQIHYWPMLGRAGALIRMCAEAGVDYTHSTAADPQSTIELLAPHLAALGGKVTNFAPPLVVDGNICVSQSVAATAYLGERFGFTENISIMAVAVQYCLDLHDFFSSFVQSDGMSVLDPAQLKRWIEGERCASMLEMFEQQIVGPFYFGDKFTFVDFFACQVVTLLDARVLGPLETVSVALLDKSTKLREVSNRIAALPSAASIKAPVALGEYCLGADAVEEYRCAK